MKCERCATRAVVFIPGEGGAECLACGHVRGEHPREPTAEERAGRANKPVLSSLRTATSA